MECHRTKDILQITGIPVHRNIKNDVVYTHLMVLESNSYICKAAANARDATELIQAAGNMSAQ